MMRVGNLNGGCNNLRALRQYREHLGKEQGKRTTSGPKSGGRKVFNESRGMGAHLRAPLDLFHRKAAGKKGSRKALNIAGAKNESNKRQLTALFLLGLLGGTVVHKCSRPTPAASNSGGRRSGDSLPNNGTATSEPSFLPSNGGQLHSDASEVPLVGTDMPPFSAPLAPSRGLELFKSLTNTGARVLLTGSALSSRTARNNPAFWGASFGFYGAHAAPLSSSVPPSPTSSPEPRVPQNATRSTQKMALWVETLPKQNRSAVLADVKAAYDANDSNQPALDIHVGFVWPKSSGEIPLSPHFNGTLPYAKTLASISPANALTISCGGVRHSSHFREALEKNPATFKDSLVALSRKHGANINLDFEFPKTVDEVNRFVAFIEDVKNGIGDKKVSVEVSASYHLAPLFSHPKFLKLLSDGKIRANIMAYDYIRKQQDGPEYYTSSCLRTTNEPAQVQWVLDKNFTSHERSHLSVQATFERMNNIIDAAVNQNPGLDQRNILAQVATGLYPATSKDRDPYAVMGDGGVEDSDCHLQSEDPSNSSSNSWLNKYQLLQRANATWVSDVLDGLQVPAGGLSVYKLRNFIGDLDTLTKMITDFAPRLDDSLCPTAQSLSNVASELSSNEWSDPVRVGDHYYKISKYNLKQVTQNGDDWEDVPNSMIHWREDFELLKTALQTLEIHCNEPALSDILDSSPPSTSAPTPFTPPFIPAPAAPSLPPDSTSDPLLAFSNNCSRKILERFVDKMPASFTEYSEPIQIEEDIWVQISRKNIKQVTVDSYKRVTGEVPKTFHRHDGNLSTLEDIVKNTYGFCDKKITEALSKELKIVLITSGILVALCLSAIIRKALSACLNSPSQERGPGSEFNRGASGAPTQPQTQEVVGASPEAVV